ncbi:FadR/GntR family transcriptional regulator [Nocardiopsis oceani]
MPQTSSMVATEHVRVPKTAEVVAQVIRGQIVSGEIPEGGALPSESELMAQFGVSRPSLREAFRVLESERLITVRRGSRGGARASRPDVTVAARYLGLMMQFDGVMLKDVYEARALIEPLAIRLLAQRRNRATATRKLMSILRELEGLEAEPEVRAQIWTRFYVTLFECAGNKTLALLYGTLTEVVHKELVDALTEDNGDLEATLKVIDKAMGLVREGKSDEAAEFWGERMQAIQKRTLRTHRAKTLVDIYGGH